MVTDRQKGLLTHKNATYWPSPVNCTGLGKNPFADNFHSNYLEFLITVESDEIYVISLIWEFIPILTKPNSKHTDSI